MPRLRALRLLTYLAPSLPRELFVAIGLHCARTLGRAVTVQCDARSSAPLPAADDPLSRGEADVAFLCAPGYRRLRDLSPSPVALVPAAPVFSDPRAAGRPIYFADVVVRRGDPARGIADLARRVWAWNDAASWSGQGSVLQAMAGLGVGGHEVRGLESGSHLASLQMVVTGAVDAAAIDSNVLRIAQGRDPLLREQLEVVDSLGPHPIQPVVARASLPAAERDRLAQALLALDRDDEARAATEPFGLAGFAPVSDDDYATRATS